MFQNVFSLGYLFFSAFGPRTLMSATGPTASQIKLLQFQGIGWYNRDEVLIKILHKNVVIFKNTTYIINRRIFRVLFVQGILST